MNDRQIKKARNTLEVDTLDYLKEFEDRLFKTLDKSEAKADAWREKREQDLENIKNKVYEALERVEKKQDRIETKQAEIEQKQALMDNRLTQNTNDTASIKKDVDEVKKTLESMDKYTKKQIFSFIGAGIGSNSDYKRLF